MHEMSLMADLLKKIETVAKEKKARRVSGICVWLGAFSHISGDHFRNHFIEGAKGTVGEGAQLTIEESTDIADPHANEILLKSIDLKTE